jgi:hypothetical protein
MLAIAWNEEEKALLIDNTVRGLSIGKNNDATLNDMWSTVLKPTTGRI